MSVKELPLDFTQLRSLTGDDPEFMIEILEIIHNQSPEVKEELYQKYETGALKDLGAVAHKYKSSINVLGNRELNQLIHRIEVAGDQGKMEILEPLLLEFQQICDRLLLAIDQALGELR